MKRSARFGIYDDAGRLLTLEEARRAIADFTTKECRDALRRFGASADAEDESVEALRSRCYSALARHYGQQPPGPAWRRILTSAAMGAVVWAGLAWLVAHIPIVQIPLLLIAAPLRWLGFDLTEPSRDVGFTFLYVVLTSARINVVLLGYYWMLSMMVICLVKLLGALADRLE